MFVYPKSNSCIPGQSVCGFEAEMTSAEEEGLSVVTDFFERSNVDPVRLRITHAAWMTPIQNSRGMPFETVQRSQAPNNAW